jgi:hypothetical protein
MSYSPLVSSASESPGEVCLYPVVDVTSGQDDPSVSSTPPPSIPLTQILPPSSPSRSPSSTPEYVLSPSPPVWPAPYSYRLPEVLMTPGLPPGPWRPPPLWRPSPPALPADRSPEDRIFMAPTPPPPFAWPIPTPSVFSPFPQRYFSPPLQFALHSIGSPPLSTVFSLEGAHFWSHRTYSVNGSTLELNRLFGAYTRSEVNIDPNSRYFRYVCLTRLFV